MSNSDEYQLFDPSIRFNPPPWDELIDSQTPLFKREALERASDTHRDAFYNGTANGWREPTIKRHEWVSDLLAQYDRPAGEGILLGYDIPCLLTADRPSKGRVMLCAQDPWRSSHAKDVQVGTFFGINHDNLRRKSHYKAIWQFVRLSVHAGYDMWLTDALKIFAGKGVVRSNEELYRQCVLVLRDEIIRFQPDKILSIGNVARDTLRDTQAGVPYKHVKHPNARGVSGTFHEKIVHGWSQELFGTNLP